MLEDSNYENFWKASIYARLYLRKLQNSLAEKTHLRVCICGHFIYSIGGYNNMYHLIPWCERYNMKLNKWKVLPGFDENYLPMLSFLFNNQWVYALCGKLDDKGVHFWKLLNSSPIKWECLIPMLNGFISDYYHALQISSSDILLLGGTRKNTTNNSYNKRKK